MVVGRCHRGLLFVVVLRSCSVIIVWCLLMVSVVVASSGCWFVVALWFVVRLC